jgi:hypothetical protein
MNIGDKSGFVKISYRDGKIVKNLSLNLNDKNDRMFYESYQRLPLDNRNYMASLYAREQEHGVNDATGHRVQELALVTPKEDNVIMREKRNAELDSLKESKAHYEGLINKIMADAMGAELSATQKAQKEEYEKKIAEIKRKIRNIDASWTKALNSEVFRTGHLSGLSPLTRDALMESLETVSKSMGENVVAFLEDKIEQLPANATGENGSEQFALTNAAYLAAMCEKLGFEEVYGLSNAIKRFYGLLRAITQGALTQAAYDSNYAQSIKTIIEIMNLVDDIDVPGFLNKDKTNVIGEQLRPIAINIKFTLGRAAYKTYVEADKRHLPSWDNIKAILDGSLFKAFIPIGDEENTFKETGSYQNAEGPYKTLQTAIKGAAEAIYDYWQDVPAVGPDSTPQQWKAFDEKIDELKDAEYYGYAKFKRSSNARARISIVKRDDQRTRASAQKAVELTTAFDLKDNTLKVTGFKATNTQFERELHGIEFSNWLRHKETPDDQDIYAEPNIDKDEFISEVTNAVLSQLNIPEKGELSPDVMRALVSRESEPKGSGARYRTFDSPEEKFHNIIDMGNPLKAIRSRYRR